MDGERSVRSLAQIPPASNPFRGHSGALAQATVVVPDLDLWVVYTCPVCEHDGLSAPPYEQWPPPSTFDEANPPYEPQLGRPSYEVCPRCGFEFGNDDNPGTAAPSSFGEYRNEWIARGRPWFDPTSPD